MNLDEYRAMAAEQAQADQETQQQDSQGKVEQPDAQAVQTATPIAEETPQATPETDNPPQAEPEQTNPQAYPETIEVDGEQVPVEELTKGYLRQSDYTRKTQELAEARKQAELAEQYYNAVQQNPEFARKFAETFNLPYLTPEQERVQRLEQENMDLKLRQEIGELKNAYSLQDEQVRDVLQIAYDRRLENLDDAYALYAAREVASTPADSLDVDSLKEQIRQELMQELKLEVDTTSIIGSGNSSRPVQSNTPQLSPQEAKVARMMGMNDKEYATWKNKK